MSKEIGVVQSAQARQSGQRANETYDQYYYRTRRKPQRQQATRKTVAERHQQELERKHYHPIAVARIERGLSVRQLASAIDSPTSIASLYEIEQGRAMPSPLKAEKLALVLGFANKNDVMQQCRQWQAKFRPISHPRKNSSENA